METKVIKVTMKNGKEFNFLYSDNLYKSLNSALNYNAKFFYLSDVYFAIDSIAYIEIINIKDGK